jgi:hypothetical protein
LSVAWDPSPSPDVASYTLRWGTNAGSYLASTNVGNVTNFTLSNALLFPGTNYMIVVAVNSAGLSSDPSNEINFAIPAAPKNFRLSLETSSTPAGPWHEVSHWVYADLTNSATAFYRAKVYPP